MKKLLLLFILLTFVLGACNQSNKVDKSVSAEQKSISMPEEMPQDFGFSLQFGHGMRKKIDTFNGTVSNENAIADMTLSDKEMSDIYQKMREINVLEEKNFVPEIIDGKTCAKIPHEEDEWNITLNGETIHHYISGAPCIPTKDGSEFLKLRNFVYDKVKIKKEYQELPASGGGVY